MTVKWEGVANRASLAKYTNDDNIYAAPEVSLNIFICDIFCV